MDHGCHPSSLGGPSEADPTQTLSSARRVAPQFFIRPNTTYTVPMGGSLEITCAAVGHPVPTVSWTLLPTDGQASTAASENVIAGLKEEALGRKVLKLTNMAKTVRLKCRADSNLGAIEAISTVRVSGG